MTKKALTLTALILFSSALVSFSSPKQITIGFSNWSNRFDFYQQMERGIKETAAKNGVQVLVADPNGDQATQQSEIENFAAQKVDAIIMVPIDSKAVIPTIEYANQRKIPVVTVDIAAAGGKVVTFIASDNTLGGKLAADEMAKRLNGKGKVALITYRNISSTREREQGFVDEIKKYPGIQIVASQTGEDQRDKAMALTENYFAKYPDLKGIFGVNDMQALGALAAAQAANKNDIAIIGFDASPEAITAMKQKTQYVGSVAQQPYLLGQLAVEAALKNLQGKPVDPTIPVPVKMINQDNVNQ